ncbi:MAG: Mut7-C RNAse domain-containing protein [Spirochaetes bacterium]|nr:Mut7-C RNAse domain-containing protein [Spirochaetota bacterium]
MNFICDNNLGKLVRLLRMAGFDTAEDLSHSYEQMIKQSLEENRVLITRDSKLINKINKEKLKISYVKIHSARADEQMKQVLKECKAEIPFDKLFTRCTLCNAGIIPIEKEKVKGKIPRHAFEVQEEFWICPECQHLYWAGTHWARITKRFREISKE